MTTKLGSVATAKTIQRITGPTGVNSSLAALSASGGGLAAVVGAAQVRGLNAAADLAERAGTIAYPAVNVYCEKIVNALTEKFRGFSGTAQMAVELRHSDDRLEGLQDALELYADSVMQMLNASRGDWGDGMFYGGEYQVSFGAVKHGGKNFIQTAKVTFEIGVSRS
jgi:hypothetical protein